MKIVIVDDHEIFRLGLRALLEAEQGFEVIGEAEDGKTGLKVIAETLPDIVILDYSMPGLSGLEIMQILRQKFPQVKVILLTATKSESILSEALNTGANGLILKKDTSNQLVQAVESVLHGEQIISTSIIPLVKRFDMLSELTNRERQVLRMIANGYRNREISEALSVALKTVDTHRTNLMRKLNLHSLADLIEFANTAGLNDPSI